MPPEEASARLAIPGSHFFYFVFGLFFLGVVYTPPVLSLGLRVKTAAGARTLTGLRQS